MKKEYAYESRILWDSPFKKVGIGNFSGFDINGYKTPKSLLVKSDGFPNVKGVGSGFLSPLWKRNKLIHCSDGIKEFDQKLETNNPVKAVVVPMERSI